MRTLSFHPSEVASTSFDLSVPPISNNVIHTLRAPHGSNLACQVLTLLSEKRKIVTYCQAQSLSAFEGIQWSCDSSTPLCSIYPPKPGHAVTSNISIQLKGDNLESLSLILSDVASNVSNRKLSLYK